MVITYHGGEFFKVTFGSTTLAFNPISKDSNLKTTRFGADIALQTLNHPDMNGLDQLSHGSKEPFAITGPGEYEIGGIIAKGFASDSKYGEKNGARINTIYVITLEDMNLGFLGALGNRKLPNDAKEAFDDIDILFVPIGGDGVLTPSEAHELAVELEPNIIIPMHYGEMGGKDSLKQFLKESDEEGMKAIDKLTIKKKEVADKDGEIVVLSAQ